MSEFNEKRQKFEQICQNIEVKLKRKVLIKRVTCPCCGYPTLERKGRYEICELCNWEDDGQDDHDADTIWCGPNGVYSLSAARKNFQTYRIMYTPDNNTTVTGADSPQREALKSLLMGIFEELLNSDPSKHPSLWQRAAETERELHKETRKSLQQAFQKRLEP